MVAAGVRRDVSPAPLWFNDLILGPLEHAGILPEVILIIFEKKKMFSLLEVC